MALSSGQPTALQPNLRLVMLDKQLLLLGEQYDATEEGYFDSEEE